MTLATLVVGVLVVLASFAVSEVAQRAIARALKHRGVESVHGAGVMGRLLHYAFVVAGVAVALQTAGIELFKTEGIVIAFPQLDVHFDPPIDKALTRGVQAA